MPFGSRQKGANAEREVAKLMVKWWEQLEPGVSFVKTPLSGGWSTAKVRSDLRASGDLMSTAKLFPFTVEVKRREFNSHRVQPGLLKASPIWGWWEQAIKAANEQKGVPLLVFRKNHEEWRGLLPASRKSLVWLRKPEIVGARLMYSGTTDLDHKVVLFPLDLLLATDPRYWSVRGND